MELISENNEQLKALCFTHHVETLYLFGSATSSHFPRNSDLDLLVKFKPFDLASYFKNYTNFKAKLKTLFHRDIDLLEEQTLKNPILIKSINKSKELIYG